MLENDALLTMKYDMHVASEGGDSASLGAGLAKLGFKDDNLAQQGLTFDEETAKHYKSCPIIDIHASKKVATIEELRELGNRVHQIMVETGAVGYWHGESVAEDEHIESPIKAFRIEPLPFRRLISRPRNKEKVWDIHLAIQEALLVKELRDTLIGGGLYYLSRWKQLPGMSERERFAVFTVQGISPATEGQRFYTELCGWLRKVAAPSCDIKLEITTAMKLYLSPKAVPPTIEFIEWVR